VKNIHITHEGEDYIKVSYIDEDGKPDEAEITGGIAIEAIKALTQSPSTWHDDTRLFFVVDSRTESEEIFETLEEAKQYAAENLIWGRIRICLVRNAFKEEGLWNYVDQIDTFTAVKTLLEDGETFI